MAIMAWSLLPVELSGENLMMFLLLGSLAAGLSTMAKSGFGGGVGMLSTPLMVFACGENVNMALGIMLPMLIISDYVILINWWRQWNTRSAMSLVPGAIIGLIMGWVTLAALQGPISAGRKEFTNGVMMLCVGAIALGFVILHVIRSAGRGNIAFKPVPWQAMVVGTAAGFTSTMAHAAGPIVTMYLLPQGMSKTRFVATTALYYWIGNQMKLLPYYFLGMINYGTLGANVALLPSVVVGAVLGVFLHRKLGEKQFAGVVYGLLGLAGAHLILKACLKLWGVPAGLELLNYL